MTYRGLPRYARKAATPEIHQRPPTCSMSNDMVIAADQQSAIFGDCLRSVFLIYEHYKLRQEQVFAVSELFVPRKEPRYKVEIASSAWDRSP